MSGWQIYWRLTRDRRTAIAGLAVASFAGAVLEAGFLVLITAVLLSLAGDADRIGPLAGVTLSASLALAIATITLLARLAFGLLTVRLSTSLSAAIRASQRQRLSRAFLSASWSVQSAEPPGRLQELLTSFIGRVNVAVNAGTQGVTAALSLLAFLAAGIGMQPVATVAVLASLAVLAAILGPLRRVIRRRSAAAAVTDLDFVAAVSELGGLGLEMQAFGVQPQFVARVDDLTLRSTQQQRKVQSLAGALTPIYTFFAYAVIVIAITVLSILDVGNLTAIGAVMLLMLRSLSYGQQLSSVLGTVSSALPSLEQLERTTSLYETRVAPRGTVRPTQVTPLRLTEVSFGYSADRGALHQVTMEIGANEIVGVIGPSGSGKSTLAQLILGLRQPDEGTVTAGGVPLPEVDQDWWARSVAFVPQDAHLISGTMADNIRFFRFGISDEAVVDAARRAHLLRDIAAMPSGLDTHLGPRGTGLSGGQRQRVCIARALVGQPQVLVLDEPTSALDSQSEQLVRTTLEELRGTVSALIIAHRMSTLELCDRILVVEAGRITGAGTRENLARDSEFYRRALDASR